MRRPDTDKYLFSTIDKRVLVLKRVPVDLVWTTQVATAVLGVKGVHGGDTAARKFLGHGPVREERAGLGLLRLGCGGGKEGRLFVRIDASAAGTERGPFDSFADACVAGRAGGDG
jgi:hypothetical protein